MDIKKEKRGYLWHETEASIERKGTFQINGEKRYGAIVKSFNNKGEPKYEFMVSTGLLYLNTDRKSPKSANMGGNVTIDGEVYRLGCWANESESGPYTSLKFDEPMERESQIDEENPKF